AARACELSLAGLLCRGACRQLHDAFAGRRGRCMVAARPGARFDFEVRGQGRAARRSSLRHAALRDCRSRRRALAHRAEQARGFAEGQHLMVSVGFFCLADEELRILMRVHGGMASSRVAWLAAGALMPEMPWPHACGRDRPELMRETGPPRDCVGTPCTLCR